MVGQVVEYAGAFDPGFFGVASAAANGRLQSGDSNPRLLSYFLAVWAARELFKFGGV
uniref:HDC10913 n=1 Tax=Drosophila melanogaster TaxID=7227 RepID=Q6IL04_DROME|nr:TPA_inf: HDC10913 [Drosophila melanogaster]